MPLPTPSRTPDGWYLLTEREPVGCWSLGCGTIAGLPAAAAAALVLLDGPHQQLVSRQGHRGSAEMGVPLWLFLSLGMAAMAWFLLAGARAALAGWRLGPPARLELSRWPLVPGQGFEARFRRPGADEAPVVAARLVFRAREGDDERWHEQGGDPLEVGPLRRDGDGTFASLRGRIPALAVPSGGYRRAEWVFVFDLAGGEVRFTIPTAGA